MKPRTAVITILSSAALFVCLYFYWTISSSLERMRPVDIKSLSPDARARVQRAREEHNKSLRAIDEAWDYVGLGNSYDAAGRYTEAADAYRKAYSIGGGSSAVSGLKLAMTYENLGEYDQGVAIIDDLIKNDRLSENGIQNANEIRARLLAAKNQPNKTQ